VADFTGHIPRTTNRKPEMLTVILAIDIRMMVIQAPRPCAVLLQSHSTFGWKNHYVLYVITSV